MTKPTYIPLSQYRAFPADEMLRRTREFHEHLKARRTVREYAERAVPREVIE